MKRFIVNITNEALADMENIYDYIAHTLLAPESAKGQYNRIADAILSLEIFPDRYKLFDSEPEHSLGIHKMIVDNYLVCYVIDPNTVTVIDVLYGASDIHTKLQERHCD